MRDPDLVQRAERAAVALERAWVRWRDMHGLAADPPPPVSSYVGYSLEEPWGQPRVVFGLGAEEAERLAALLDGHDCVGPVHAEVSALPEWRRGAAPAAWPLDSIPPQAVPAEYAASELDEVREPAVGGPGEPGSANVNEGGQASEDSQPRAAGAAAGSGDEPAGNPDSDGGTAPAGAGTQPGGHDTGSQPVTAASLPRIFPAAPLLPVAAHGRDSAGLHPAARHAAGPVQSASETPSGVAQLAEADGTAQFPVLAQPGIVAFRPRQEPPADQPATAGQPGTPGQQSQAAAEPAGTDTEAGGAPTQGPGYRGPRYRGFPPQYQSAEPGFGGPASDGATASQLAESARPELSGSRQVSSLSRSWRSGTGGHEAVGWPRADQAATDTAV